MLGNANAEIVKWAEGAARAWIWGAGGASGYGWAVAGLSARKARQIRRKAHFYRAQCTSGLDDFEVMG